MAVGKGSGRAGGAVTTPREEVPRAKRANKGAGRQGGATTPGRPRVRAAEMEQRIASPNAAKGKVSDTPTRQLRRQAAEGGLLSLDSPVRLSPRPESPRAELPQVEGSPRGKKRRVGEGADEGEAENATRQSKRARIASAVPDATLTPQRAQSAPGSPRATPVSAEAAPVDGKPMPKKEAGSSREIKVFRTFTGPGLRSLLHKDKKTPSSEELRRDPDDEGYEWRESGLPEALSFMFSRGAIPTTVLDSTTEEAPPRGQNARAPRSETEKGEG